MKTLKRRILRVRDEAGIGAVENGRLPTVVSDDTSKAEIARLRAHGREVLTFTEMANRCLVEFEPGAAA